MGSSSSAGSKGAPSRAPLPALIVITDWSLGAEALLARLRAALSVSPRVAVLHRHPGATGRQLLAEAEALAALCAPGAHPLFVGDRLDVALRVGAHLHLPAHGLLPKDVRAALPAGRWVSRAVHDEAEAAAADGADLALVSPVFAPGSKPKDTRAPLGLAGLKALAARLTCPAFALGGITPERASELPAELGLAVIGAVLGAPDPAGAVSALLATRTVAAR